MEWVDWTKIIGIFLVTLGHGNLVSVELNTFIYSFHMPLFFILSGILFKYRNFIESLKKRMAYFVGSLFHNQLNNFGIYFNITYIERYI